MNLLIFERKPKNNFELQQRVQELWDSIDIETINRLIESFYYRLILVAVHNGESIQSFYRHNHIHTEEECAQEVQNFLQNILKRFDSFPFLTPPSEQSYAENTKTITDQTFFPLESQELFDNCKQYILTGTFLPDEAEDKESEKIAEQK